MHGQMDVRAPSLYGGVPRTAYHLAIASIIGTSFKKSWHLVSVFHIKVNVFHILVHCSWPTSCSSANLWVIKPECFKYNKALGSEVLVLVYPFSQGEQHTQKTSYKRVSPQISRDIRELLM